MPTGQTVGADVINTVCGIIRNALGNAKSVRKALSARSRKRGQAAAVA